MNGTRAVATASAAAFAVNSEGEIIAWNEDAEQCLGHRYSDVIGQCCWRVLEGRDLSSNRYCDETCPARKAVLEGDPVNPAQLSFCPINRAQLFCRNASGELTEVDMTTFMVQGEAAKRELVHVLRGP